MLTLLRQFEKTDLRRLGNVTLKPETKLRLRAFMRGIWTRMSASA